MDIFTVGKLDGLNLIPSDKTIENGMRQTPALAAEGVTDLDSFRGAYGVTDKGWHPGSDWMPYGLAVPKTMAESEAYAKKYHGNSVVPKVSLTGLPEGKLSPNNYVAADDDTVPGGKGEKEKKGQGEIKIISSFKNPPVKINDYYFFAVLAALLMPGISWGAAAAEKPNFVIIFTDDQGYGDLSCHGGNHISTPRIDQMAEEGAKLTSFYVAAPVCTPSRAGLMTGCYPKRINMATGSNFGVLLAGDKKGLNPEEVTIPEVLKTAGYKSGMFGKWHLGDQPEFLPTKQGFDEFFGIPYSHDIHSFHPRQERHQFSIAATTRRGRGSSRWSPTPIS